MPYITLPTVAGNINAVAWRPQGDRFALATTASPYLVVVDAQTGAVESGWSVVNTSAANDLAWSPDGTMLAVVVDASNSSDRTQVFDVASKVRITGFEVDGLTSTGVGGVAWSLDGQYLAARGRILNLADKMTVPRPLFTAARSMVWDPNGGNRIAVGRLTTANPRFAVWVPDGSGGFVEEAGWPAINQNVLGVAWSPDGSQLACVYSTVLRVFNVATKTTQSGWPGLAGIGYGVAWSGDGSRLAVAHAGGNNVSVYNVATKSAEFGWPALPATGKGVAFAFDPGNVASG